MRMMPETRDDTGAALGAIGDLLDRAQRALTQHLHPEVAKALVMLEGAAGPRSSGSPAGGPGGEEAQVIARLCIDPKTKDVFVRFFDARSGTTLREVTPTYVAEIITRLPPTIANESDL